MLRNLYTGVFITLLGGIEVGNYCNWVCSQLMVLCWYMRYVLLFWFRFQIRASWPYLSIIYFTTSWTHWMLNCSVEIWVCVTELPFCLLFVYYTVLIRYGKSFERQNSCGCWTLLCWNTIYDYDTLLNATELLYMLFVPMFIGQWKIYLKKYIGLRFWTHIGPYNRSCKWAGSGFFSSSSIINWVY